LAAAWPVADEEGVGVTDVDGVVLAVAAGDEVAGGVEGRPGCWLVVCDSSVACLGPPASAPFTVQATSASMPRPAASAMTLRRQ
jgi:hypothetical protein